MGEGEHSSVLAFISSPKKSSFWILPVSTSLHQRASIQVEQICLLTSGWIPHIVPSLLLSHSQMLSTLFSVNLIVCISFQGLLSWGESGLNPLVSLGPDIYNYYHINWHLIVCHFAMLSEYSLPTCALYSC